MSNDAIDTPKPDPVLDLDAQPSGIEVQLFSRRGDERRVVAAPQTGRAVRIVFGDPRPEPAGRLCEGCTRDFVEWLKIAPRGTPT